VNLQTVNLVWNALFLQTMLEALATRPAAALAPAMTVHLYSNDYTPLPTDTVASYTEADFSGYADVAATLLGPITPSQAVQAMLADCFWLATAATPFVPQTAVGYYCVSGGLLVASERFASGVPFAAPGSFLSFALILPLRTYAAAS
jgi:hypothetical protein